MTDTRHLLIDGEHRPASGGRTTEDLDPWRGRPLALVAAAAPADVTRAVDAAHAAFPAWAATPPSARRKILNRAADLLEERAHEAATLMGAETGGPFGWAMFNVGLATGMLREAAALVSTPLGEVLATDNPDALALGIRQPAGVVAAFAPWNAPIILGTRAIATPLAVGNTVVVKASEDAPLVAAHYLADLLHEAGLPPGVLNVITNDRADAAAIAETLIADERVRRVNFTGSTGVGRRIGELAARHLTPAVLELGGKNSILVLDDADLEYAVNAVAFGAYLNAGQICMSADRILVHRAVADEFTALLAAKAAALPAGDPSDPSTVIGPLISEGAARRVAALVDEAAGQGAKVVAGGGAPDRALYPATVLSGVEPHMRIHSEEIFGPVCTVLTVDDADQAVAIANDSPYGLTAGVLTSDLSRGLDLARRLQTGIVHVNDQSVDDEPIAPFGGVKASGYGRFGGRAGIDAFTDLRWITLQQRPKHFPF
ncbi:acyl-CoA reductase-like NAD-dependent aldehyde dehydrogenase [Catenuloplanes nepalensis]|uniref:Acyl-CoA reductase-like NAD-dependent aldehyde dehydrogenase n=1 Tax=Catenuloplanes nepalensis TaxID=587533 RepID=A0ABT9MZL1_9ACTN|nr:aldehyde dehydrogenase family protein [Catenuloplanes nepalensis]MDP9796683.1 acyl-CoA reductase-like NAD-dependent aldehyde dehydrogenase [Catenuloplanes nepalensis]